MWTNEKKVKWSQNIHTISPLTTIKLFLPFFHISPLTSTWEEQIFFSPYVSYFFFILSLFNTLFLLLFLHHISPSLSLFIPPFLSFTQLYINKTSPPPRAHTHVPPNFPPPPVWVPTCPRRVGVQTHPPTVVVRTDSTRGARPAGDVHTLGGMEVRGWWKGVEEMIF